MFCLFSMIFIFVIASQFETGMINNLQFWFYSIYGLLMLYYTSKPYWTENIEAKNKEKKKRTNPNEQERN